MEITRTHPLTGESNTMDLPVTQAQLDRYERGNELIQSVFPELTVEEREFIKSGINDWDVWFPS